MGFWNVGEDTVEKGDGRRERADWKFGEHEAGKEAQDRCCEVIDCGAAGWKKRKGLQVRWTGQHSRRRTGRPQQARLEAAKYTEPRRETRSPRRLEGSLLWHEYDPNSLQHRRRCEQKLDSPVAQPASRFESPFDVPSPSSDRLCTIDRRRRRDCLAGAVEKSVHLGDKPVGKMHCRSSVQRGQVDRARPCITERGSTARRRPGKVSEQVGAFQ